MIGDLHTPTALTENLQGYGLRRFESFAIR